MFTADLYFIIKYMLTTFVYSSELAVLKGYPQVNMASYSSSILLL